MTKSIKNIRKIEYTLNEKLGSWIDLSNSCGEESSVDNIRNIATRYLTYYFPSDQKAKENLVNLLEPTIGKYLMKHCLRNTNVPIGLCLKEIIEVRSILMLCANWNKTIGNLSPKDIDFEDLVNNPITISPETISFEGIQDIETQSRFEYSTNLNTRIRLGENNFYLKPEISEFFRLLDKENIDIRLIRFCKHCNNIFWLERGNQKTCSPKCTNAAGSAKWRRKQKEIDS